LQIIAVEDVLQLGPAQAKHHLGPKQQLNRDDRFDRVATLGVVTEKLGGKLGTTWASL